MLFDFAHNYHRFKKDRKGFTIVEVLIVVVFLSVLLPLIGLMSYVGLKTFREGFAKTSLVSESSLIMTRLRKPLLQAKSIDAITPSSLTFTADDGGGDKSYRIYLYNSSDVEPNPPYTQNSYQLLFAKGSIAYGDGVVLSENLVQPTSSVFSQSGGTVSIFLDMKRDESTFKVRTNIRPRNF